LSLDEVVDDEEASPVEDEPLALLVSLPEEGVLDAGVLDEALLSLVAESAFSFSAPLAPLRA
jgi:hypothetical protein